MKLALPILLGLVLAAEATTGAGAPDGLPALKDSQQSARPIWKFETSSFLKKNPAWNASERSTLQQLAQNHSDNPALLLEAAMELISIERNDASLILLDALLHNSLETGAAVANESGGKDLQNLRLRDATYAHAMRYFLRKSPDDFQQARRLLLAFAQVMPKWPLMLNRTWKATDEKNWVSQDDPLIYSKFASGGLWGRWYHLDLSGSYPLLRAYDLIYERLSATDRETIERGIFNFQTELIERWPEIYHNTAVYKIEGLIRFGLVLKQPEPIHRAVKLIEDLFHIGFSPDGFWHEATPAYHRQVASRLTRTFPDLLDGYSDPPGWRDPATGKRFDNLNLRESFKETIERIGRSQEKLTLPSGYLAALNDTDPEYYFESAKDQSRPELLGTSGVAILGSGAGKEQRQLFINFTGTHGHEHFDVNAIHWYALGSHVIDETRYRPLKGSDSSRAWSASTYAHQTVVIDEKDQPWRFSKARRAFNQDDAIRGVATWPLRGSAGGTNHMGELLLFDSTRSDVQVVEVEGKRGYGGAAELYRRTIVKVDLGQGEGYLVDVFRVKGGKLHDYMLHGPLGLPHRAEFSFPLNPASGVLGPKNAHLPDPSKKPRYIEIQEEAVASTPWHVTFAADNGLKLTSWVIHPDKALVLSGKAPAINHLGDAPFIAVRKEGGETLFIAVHEVYRHQPRLKGARLLTNPGDATSGVALEVDLGHARHLVFSTLGPDQVVTAVGEGGTFSLTGRLGWVQVEGERVKRGALWDGTRLQHPGGAVASSHAAFEGKVTRTLRRAAGDTGNALVVSAVLPDSLSLEGKSVHVDLGGQLTWSYRVEKAEKSNNETVLHLEHDPGFDIAPSGLTKMLYHPGWGTRSPVTFRIPIDKSF